MEALVVDAQQCDAQRERCELTDQGRVVEPFLTLATHQYPPEHDQGRILNETNLEMRNQEM